MSSHVKFKLKHKCHTLHMYATQNEMKWEETAVFFSLSLSISMVSLLILLHLTLLIRTESPSKNVIYIYINT